MIKERFIPLLLFIIMENLNDFDYEQLLNLLDKLIEKKVYTILNNFGVESSSYGKVTKIDAIETDSDGNVSKVIRASISLPDGTSVSNLYNASERVLSVGDKVKIFGSTKDLSNRYIGIKYD